MNDVLKSTDLAAVQSHSAVYEDALLATRRNELRLSNILKDYRTITDVLDKGLRKITVQDTLRDRSIIVYAFDELILSISFGAFTDEVDVGGGKLKPIVRDARLTQQDRYTMMEYENSASILVALLEGRYKVIPDKGVIRMHAEGFSGDYDLMDATQAGLTDLQPAGPFGTATGIQKVAKRSWATRIGDIDIPDTLVYKILAALAVVVSLAVFVLER